MKYNKNGIGYIGVKYIHFPMDYSVPHALKEAIELAKETNSIVRWQGVHCQHEVSPTTIFDKNLLIHLHIGTNSEDKKEFNRMLKLEK